MKTVQIKPYEDFDVSFTLLVCKSRKEMMGAIAKDPTALKEEIISYEGIAGRFQENVSISDNGYPGQVFHSANIGTMFLNLEDMSNNVIVHECGHAAFALVFYVHRYSGTFKDNEQEAYCYFLAAATDKVRDAIRENFKEVKL